MIPKEKIFSLGVLFSKTKEISALNPYLASALTFDTCAIESNYYAISSRPTTTNTTVVDPTTSVQPSFFNGSGNPISFCTDVEGDLAYFKRFVAGSKALSFNETDGRLVLHDGYDFVFGGDASDKGVGSLRILALLVNLYDDYGEDRVSFLLGNRDINKMRFTSELDNSLGSLVLDPNSYHSNARPFWDLNSMSPNEYLEASEVNGTVPNQINRLKWMLDKSMGSQGDFERRRAELKEMNLASSDDDVVNSYLASVQPGGVLYRYLTIGKLAVRKGSILFVHGGVSQFYRGMIESNDYFVPGEGAYGNLDKMVGNLDKMEQFDTMDAWIEGLNRFKETQLTAWTLEPAWSVLSNATHHVRGGNDLIKYVLRVLPSVVAGRHTYLDTGMPFQMLNDQMETFNRDGITTIVSGHTPSGVTPTVIAGKVKVFMADTCYSNPTFNPRDTRGQVTVSELLFSKDGRYVVHGVFQLLEDGEMTTWKVAYDHTDEAIGIMMPETSEYSGFFIKAKVYNAQEKPAYLLCKVENGGHPCLPVT